MNTRSQMLCLWCGPLGILFWLVGFVAIGGLIPPPSPSDSAQEIQAFYRDNTDGIRVGLVMTMIGGTLTAPWVAAITTQMKRIEGQFSPMAYTQLGLGMLGVLLFIFPVMFMQVAAFRPEDRSASDLLLINDLAWIPFVGVWSCAAVQNLAIASVALKSGQTVFPRWVGYFNLWTALLFTPGSLLYFFKDGAFAWNGAMSWWLVVVVFCLWFIVMFVVMRAAIRSQAAEEQGAPAEGNGMPAAPQDRRPVPSPQIS